MRLHMHFERGSEERNSNLGILLLPTNSSHVSVNFFVAKSSSGAVDGRAANRACDHVKEQVTELLAGVDLLEGVFEAPEVKRESAWSWRSLHRRSKSCRRWAWGVYHQR